MALEVTDADFEQHVLERSSEVPVLVDFWADWCQPCHMLAPVIEKAVDAHDGAIELVKLDVEANQATAARFEVRSLPTVKAFRDGRVVTEFTGAQPPAVVERFIDELVPSEADALAESSDEEALRKALELEPRTFGRSHQARPASCCSAARPSRPSTCCRTCPVTSWPTASSLGPAWQVIPSWSRRSRRGTKATPPRRWRDFRAVSPIRSAATSCGG